MNDVLIRTDGRAGRITLNRPAAMNALTYAMGHAMDQALRDWADDPAVGLVIVDATGPRAFCAGGDITQLYAAGCAGDFEVGRQFWRHEYRMNARIAGYPKPVVTLMQGFTMGGGVGAGCHARTRVVGETSQIAMPECGIGLVPDAGGSALLARAPGRIGAYLGATGARMGPADAILAGFADVFVPQADWPALVQRMCRTGDAALIPATPPPGRLPALRAEIDRHFAGATLTDIWRSLQQADTPFAHETKAALLRASPLSAACAVAMLHRLGPTPTLRQALEMEYRFTFRAQGEADFLEGIRAAVIDKDRNPRWRHTGPDAVTQGEVDAMLAPLGADALSFEGDAP